MNWIIAVLSIVLFAGYLVFEISAYLRTAKHKKVSETPWEQTPQSLDFWVRHTMQTDKDKLD